MELAGVVFQILYVAVIEAGKAGLQHRKEEWRMTSVRREVQEIDYEAYSRAVCDVAGSVGKHRQSVFGKDSPYDRLHRAFVICYHLYLAHPVSQIAHQMPDIRCRALSLVVRVGSAHQRKVFRHKVLVGSSFLRGDEVLPETCLHAGYRLGLSDLICAAYLLKAAVYTVLCRQVRKRCGQHFIQPKVASVHNEIDGLSHLGQFHDGIRELRSDAVVAVDPYGLSSDHGGILYGRYVHGYVIFGVRVFPAYGFFIRAYDPAEFLQFGLEYRVAFSTGKHLLKLIYGAVLLLEFRNEIVEHGGESHLARHLAEDLEIVRVLFYQHGKQHEASVLVKHPDRFDALLRQNTESQTVHRYYLNIEETVSAQILKSLLFGYQRVLIRH